MGGKAAAALLRQRLGCQGGASERSSYSRAAGRSTSYIRHQDFLKMLEASWYKPEATITNVMAVMKRAHICSASRPTR